MRLDLKRICCVLLLALIWSLSMPLAMAEGSGSLCNIGDDFVDCNEYNSATSATTPLPLGPACDPFDGMPCWVDTCDWNYIPDDSARWGVRWNSIPTYPPTPTTLISGFVETAADYREIIGQTNPDPGPNPTPGQFVIGLYSESGSWFKCTQVDSELDYDVQLDNENIGPEGVRYGPVGAIIDVAAIRDEAYARANPGAPAVAKSTRPGLASIVQVPTWFWIEPSWWRTYVGEDQSDSGRMEVTVVATPVDTVWETGEGTLTDCGAGEPYDYPFSDPDDPYACSWTYRHSTGWVGHPYRAEATVRSELTWSMTFNNGSTVEQGALPDLYTSDGFEIVTEEVLAIAGG